MSQLRCPFCGTPNSIDAEACVKCGSRLKLVGSTPSQPQPPEDDKPDWLSSIRSEEPMPDPEEPASQSEESAEPGDVPDWLARLRNKNQDETSENVSPFISETDETPFVEDESTDWLSRLGTEEPQPLEDLPASAKEPSLNAEEQEEWLKSLSDWQEEAPKEENRPAGQPVDWAARLANEPLAQKHAEQVPAEEEDQEEWLGKLQDWQEPTTGEPVAETPQEPSFSSPFMADEPGDDTPDWLKAFEKEPSEEPPFPAEAKKVTGPFSASLDEPELVSPFEQPLSSEPAEELPDWLQGLSAAAPFAAEEPAEPKQFPEEPISESPVGEDQSSSDQAPFAEELPDWLSELKPEEEPPIGQEIEGAEPIAFSPFSAELPEWLSAQVQAEESAIPKEEAPAEEDQDLQQAQLPGWLEAIRPIESVLPSSVQRETDTRIEKKGPLAGIPGTLPGEEVATRYQKPPVYSAKLQVSEKQRLHTALLESILTEETSPQTTVRERSRAPQNLARVLVGLALILVVVFVWATGFSTGIFPAVYPAEAASFQSTLAGLSASGAPTVLMVVDYQPGLVGEMQTAASGPLSDLMAAGSKIAVISSQPAGPILAEQMLNATILEHPDISFDSAAQFINLGYLAGDTSGLQAFAVAPTRVIRSIFSTNVDPWIEGGSLEEIQTLADFNAVIVVTDSVENGRDWIEQLSMRLDDTPLLMISSAQAAPLLQPYVQSGQVAGQISGLVGGVSYNSIAHQSVGIDFRTWDAYQTGIGLVIILILVGSLFYGIGSLFRKNDVGA